MGLPPLLLDAQGQLGQLGGDRVVVAVVEGQQPQLAAQVLVPDAVVREDLHRHAEQADADHLLRLLGAGEQLVDVLAEVEDHRRRGGRVVLGDVAVRARLEPDHLALRRDLRAPGGGVHGHDPEAPPDGGHQPRLVGHVAQGRGSHRVVVHLDARVLGRAAEPDRDRRVGVQDRVRDQLGDAQLGGVHQVGAADPGQPTDDPGAGLPHRLRLGNQLEGGSHVCEDRSARVTAPWPRSDTRRVTTIAM